MKLTVMLSAAFLAVLLHDEGYRTLPLVLVIGAVTEGIIRPRWLLFRRRRCVATRRRRERDGVMDGDIKKIKSEFLRIPYLLKYGFDNLDGSG